LSIPGWGVGVKPALVARILLAALLVAAVAWGFTHRDLLAADDLAARIDALGAWGPAAFIAVYIGATVAFLPGSAMTLAGGALFGPILGTVYSLTGATIGATAAFLVARHLAGDRVRKAAGGRLDALLKGVEKEGWRFVAFTRLVPLVPFNLLNYMLGLTRIRLLPYFLATAICMIPGAAAFTWLGHAGKQAADGDAAAIRTGLIALALLATVVFVVPRMVAKRRAATE
jgi:uncharacterized membrane protein YdjX (TVP38/TMEM64 family)